MSCQLQVTAMRARVDRQRSDLPFKISRIWAVAEVRLRFWP